MVYFTNPETRISISGRDDRINILSELYNGSKMIVNHIVDARSVAKIVSPEMMVRQLEKYRDTLPQRFGNITDTNRKPHHFSRLLTNTLSSRYDLKRENAECQTLMEKWAGPFTALSISFGL